MLKRTAALFPVCVWLVLLCAPAVPARAEAAPAAAAAAAGDALQGFKARHAADAATWGLTPDSLQNLSLGAGHHVLTWHAAAPTAAGGGAPALTIGPPSAGDQWVFTAGPETQPALLLFVAETDRGWSGIRVQRVTPDQASALADALALLQARGLTPDADPDYFMVGGYAFWYLHAGGLDLMYPTLPEQHPAMAEFQLDRKHLYPAGLILERLAGQSPGTDDSDSTGGGAGQAHRFVLLGLTGLLPAGLGWFFIRRRRTH